MWRPTVLVLLCLWGCALANRALIESQCTITEIPDGTSGSTTYFYDQTGPGVINCSTADEPRCYQKVDSNSLQGRSWYMTQDKAYFGDGYNDDFFQLFNLECPERHFLNIGFQGDFSLFCATGRDSVTANTTRGLASDICTVAEKEASYLDRPGGVILESGKARVEFCSDSDTILNRPGITMGRGFTIRGTCINLELFYNQPGCVSFDFFSAWDPAFVNDINRQFEVVPTTMVPHKRSAAEYSKAFESIREKVEEFRALAKEQSKETKNMNAEEENEREKRGVRYFFNFPAGTTITYVNNVLRFQFPNGTVRSFTVYHLSATNDYYGTRFHIRNATRQVGDQTGATQITFTGPGTVDIFPNSDRTVIKAFLRWTPPMPFEDFLESEGFQQQMIAGRIYDYITNFWVSPYVTIDEILARGDGTRPRPYPMSGGEGEFFFPKNVRRQSQVGAFFPTIEEGSICRRAVRFADAPLRSSGIDPDILEFCSFFQYACEPVLATVCREIMALDPFDVDPLTRQRMMNMMNGGD